MGDGYSERIRLWQLKLLAKSARNNGEDIIDKYYDWRESRALTVAKGMSAAALSLLSAWLIPLLKNEYGDAPDWLVVAPLVVLIVPLGAIGLVCIMRMDSIHHSYIRAMGWLQRFR